MNTGWAGCLVLMLLAWADGDTRAAVRGWEMVGFKPGPTRTHVMR